MTNTLLLLGLLAAAANVFGGLLLFPASSLLKNKRTLKFLVALGAGFLLAVNFIEILPRTLSLWLNLQLSYRTHAQDIFVFPFLLLLAGYLLVHFFEQTFTSHVHIGEDHDEMIAPSTAYTAIGGMLFHSFFDGIAIAAAAAINLNAGLLVFVAIFIHKLPEGFTVSSLMLASNHDWKETVGASAIVGAATFFGVCLVVLLGSNAAASAVPFLLPLSAGVALYVAASELIPELHHHGGKSWLFSVFVFAGVALFFILHHFLHNTLRH